MSDLRRYTHTDIRMAMVAGVFYGLLAGLVLAVVVLDNMGLLR